MPKKKEPSEITGAKVLVSISVKKYDSATIDVDKMLRAVAETLEYGGNELYLDEFVQFNSEELTWQDLDEGDVAEVRLELL